MKRPATNRSSAIAIGAWSVLAGVSLAACALAPKTAEGRIERTQPVIVSADETADVGIDLATAVVDAIGAEARSRVPGTISGVTVEVR